MAETLSSSPGSANILDALLDAYVCLDSEFRYTFVNRASEQLLGTSRADLLGKVLWDTCPELGGTVFEGNCRRAMAGRVTVTFEHIFEPCRRWYAVSAAPDSGGGIVVRFAGVTKPNGTEEAPREGEQRLLSIYTTVPDVIFCLAVEPDGQFRFVSVNPAFLSATGLSSEMVVGKTVSDVVPEPSLTMVLGKYRQAIDEKTIVRWEETSDYPAGRMTGEVSIAPVFDHRGTCTHLVGSVHDSTERKAAEKALLESEERFRTIVEMAPDAIFIANQAARLLEVNSAACRQLGLTREQLLQRSVFDIVPSRFRDQVAQKVQAPEGFFESCHLRADGTEIPVEVSIRGVVLGGQPAVLEIARDITERQGMETALREAEAKFRAMFLNGPDALYLASLEEGKISDINRLFESLFGYSRSEAIGATSLHLGLYANPADRARIVAELKANGKVSEFETEGRRKSGELFPCSLSVVTMMLGGETRIAGAIRDITERKRFDAEREKLSGQLAQAQKMESVGRLAGGVAHDFNNLLTVINGYSTLLLRDLKQDDPLRDSLEEIFKAGERAAGLTRQLLAFSRKQVLEPRRLDINRVVKDMRPMLVRLVGEDIEVRVALRAEGGMVFADPHQLEQVVMNLAVNSRDAMPRGGKLLIETACVERDESYARQHSETPAGRYVTLLVSDTGAGMDEETKNRIFEPFFTTKGVGKGTGLGLSMVQGIVAQSGGYVEVYSEEGKGTTFKIYLPALTEAAVDASSPEAFPALGGKETVLVVEDQEEVRKYAAMVLKEYGYRVIPAENAGEALMLCQRERIDLVLTDVVMPHVSGRELADRVEKLQPGIKALFMSGYSDNVITPHGILEEGANFIQKPFSPEELAGKVRSVLGPPAPAARILVADDEAGVRAFLRKVLEDAGYEVIEAADGKQALRQASAGRADLVITDLVMPEVEGIEAIQALRRDVPGVRIVAISGAFGGQFLKTAQMLGADAVLIKPVNGDLLLAKVAEVLKVRR